MEVYENLESLFECLRDNMCITRAYLCIRAPYCGNPHNRLLSPTVQGGFRVRSTRPSAKRHLQVTQQEPDRGRLR